MIVVLGAINPLAGLPVKILITASLAAPLLTGIIIFFVLRGEIDFGGILLEEFKHHRVVNGSRGLAKKDAAALRSIHVISANLFFSVLLFRLTE